MSHLIDLDKYFASVQGPAGPDLQHSEESTRSNRRNGRKKEEGMRVLEISQSLAVTCVMQIGLPFTR